MAKLIIFFAASLIFVIISWPALFQPGSRKFYRFFVFEFLLLLVLVNSRYWFYKPFSGLSIVSWMLLIISLFLFLPGIYVLLYKGKPAKFANIETTTSLVTAGIYKYVRHPLYSSLLFFGAGCLLKNPSLLAVSLFAVTAVFVYATALSEEKDNLIKFGDDYAAYTRNSKMLVPFLF